MPNAPIFDTQCHYNLSPLKDDWQSYWQKAQQNGVQKSVVIGTDWDSLELAVQIAATDPNLFASVGIHPNEMDELVKLKVTTEADFQQLKAEIETEDWRAKFQADRAKIVAIGETGLDYFHLAQESSLSEDQKNWIKELQQISFRKHIIIAQTQQLPLIVHVRDKAEQAYWDILNILRELKYEGNFNLHCVSGPIKYVQEAVEMGAYIGVAANVTYKTADHIRDLVRSVPADRLLLETDAPFLPPQEFRGKMCEPWMISKTAEFLNNELHIDLTKVWQNSLEYFSIEA
jgi:TatD DNase family protein